MKPAASAWYGSVGTVGLVLAGLLVTIGTFWAFDRGAPDFVVFYKAWSLVLEGKGVDVYRDSPDRFLYAPGFAWLLSPLALLPLQLALALWCFAKAAVVGLVVREFQPARRWGAASMGMAAWGVVLLARPLLIDFQYGQVNVLILGACCWALLGHFSRAPVGAWDLIRWAVLGLAAAAKIFPLPLLAIPWLAQAGVPHRRLWLERVGAIAGIVVALLAPAAWTGWDGALSLLEGWRQALVARGLPFESHNQSFSALLHRWFSGEPVHVVSLGMHPVRMGWSLMSETTIGLLSLSWISISAGLALAWLLRAGREAPLRWIAVAVAVLILPSHLVWKPYFVMFLPLGAWLTGRVTSVIGWAALGAVFFAMNLTGFDLLGAQWGAWCESASIMLWAALGLLIIARFCDEATPP